MIMSSTMHDRDLTERHDESRPTNSVLFSGLPGLFSAEHDCEHDCLIIRFERERLQSEGESRQVRETLESLLALHEPRLVAFNLAHFTWVSEEMLRC